MPRRVRSLGTDGFGRSEARKELREFFEVESRYVALATLAELAQNGEIEQKVVAQAMKDFGIDPEQEEPGEGLSTHRRTGDQELLVTLLSSMFSVHETDK